MGRVLFLYGVCIGMLVLGSSTPAQSGQANPPSNKKPVNKPEATLDADPTLFPIKIGRQRIYRGREVDQKVRITIKPEPEYTTAAKEKRIEGTVVLRCVFDGTGHVTHIKVVSGLPDGLNARAVKAAKKIQFTPAVKDGHSVPVWMELQYNFHL